MKWENTNIEGENTNIDGQKTYNEGKNIYKNKGEKYLYILRNIDKYVNGLKGKNLWIEGEINNPFERGKYHIEKENIYMGRGKIIILNTKNTYSEGKKSRKHLDIAEIFTSFVRNKSSKFTIFTNVGVNYVRAKKYCRF